MAEEQLTPEQLKEKQVKLLHYAKLMSERTKQEIIDRGNKPNSLESDPLGMVTKYIDEPINAQFYSNGVNPPEFSKDDLTVDRSKYAIDGIIQSSNQKANEINKEPKKLVLHPNKPKQESEVLRLEKKEEITESKKDYKKKNLIDFTDIDIEDDDIPYDMVPLPTKGEAYSHKKSGLLISYLTAADEDQIMQPSLYKEGLIYNILLKRKIKDKSIDPGNLIPCDRDALVLWLRKTGYGQEYPIVARDPETKTKFETIVDLSKIKYKPFTLKGDKNGLFEFKLPIKNNDGTQDIVKFKYLSVNEELEFANYVEHIDIRLKVYKIHNMIGDINDLLEKFELTEDEIFTFTGVKEHLENVIKSINIEEENEITMFQEITKRMCMMIKEYNGNSDPEYIEKKCKTMRSGNAIAFRRYVQKHEPKVDFEIEIKKPESLGGGSFFTTFPFDDFIFFNITE